MLKKIMVSIGFGSAKMELLLPKNFFRPGETFKAQAKITAGNLNQKAEQFYLHLEVNSEYEADYKFKQISLIIFNYNDGSPFMVGPSNPQHIVDFSCTLPLNIPLSFGRTRYIMEAGLDIKNAINPADRKDIRIKPTPEAATILTALEQIGFRHTRESGHFNGQLQWFELQPTDFMYSVLDKLAIAFRLLPNELNVFMKIDKKNKGHTKIHLDESVLDMRYSSLIIRNDQLVKNDSPDIAGAKILLQNFIDTEYKKLI